MKSVVKFLSIALASLSMLVSCNMDNVNYVDGGDDAKSKIGYLNLGNMQAEVMMDTENFDSPSGTRAEGVDISNFDVVITNKDGETVASFKYGERPQESLALEAGIYNIAMSSADMSGAAWESPVYKGEKEVIITRKQTTEVKDLVCKLANIKVTVGYSADIKDQLDPEYTKMTVELGESNLEYAFTEERAG
ncbi:MAG: DUF4493 domain-containing protein, partial [Alistipes sp.]|nr:DUF4493 domain-containing protein [Alistipes sp.]